MDIKDVKKWETKSLCEIGRKDGNRIIYLKLIVRWIWKEGLVVRNVYCLYIGFIIVFSIFIWKLIIFCYFSYVIFFLVFKEINKYVV